MKQLKRLFIIFIIGTILLLSLIIIILSIIQNNQLHDGLNKKIIQNKIIYQDLLSSLLFDLNEQNIKITINTLYDDNDIREVELEDFTSVEKLKLEKYNYKTKLKQIIPLAYNGIKVGSLKIIYTYDNINKSLKKYVYDLIIISFILAVFSFMILGYFVSKIANSLTVLNIATQEFAEGNLSYNIDEKGDDAVSLIAKNLNNMRESLEKRLSDINNKLIFQNIIMDKINVAVYVKDTNKRYININNKFIEFIGLSKKEILGKTLDELFSNKYVYDSNIIDDEILSGGIDSINKTKMYNSKDELKNIISFKTPLIKNGKIEGIIGSIYDESNIKSLE